MTWSFDVPAAPLRISEVLVSCGVLISSMESLTWHGQFAPGRLFAPPNPGPGASRWAEWFFSPVTFLILVSLRLLAVAALLAGKFIPGWPDGTLLDSAELAVAGIAGLALNVRVPIGIEGAEQMTTVVIFALALARLCPVSLVETACLWFLALQSALAYATAGFAKLKSPAWRSGSFLSDVLKTELYGHKTLARYFSNGNRAKAASWGVMIFESMFPLALLDPHLAVVIVVGGGIFHITNALAMGLNSFIWPFVATYPAILYCSQWSYR
jgi:hypothetical protein